MTDANKSLDLLGVKPIAESVKIVTKGAVDGASAFLSRICLPAAEEFGLLIKERVSHWRTRNLVAISERTQKLLTEHGGIGNLQAHPRIINDILEKGSWSPQDDIQNMWAGLLASACTSDGQDESNLLFVNLLGQINAAQARLLNHACVAAEKKLSLDNLLYAESIELTPPQLIELWHDDDLHRIDRELDHLRALDLIEGGFPLQNEEYLEALREQKKSEIEWKKFQKKMSELKENTKRHKLVSAPESEGDMPPEEPVKIELPPLTAVVRPTAITLHLFVRCQGCRTAPAEYFGLRAEPQK